MVININYKYLLSFYGEENGLWSPISRSLIPHILGVFTGVFFTISHIYKIKTLFQRISRFNDLILNEQFMLKKLFRDKVYMRHILLFNEVGILFWINIR